MSRCAPHRRWLAHPMLSVLLAIVWLLLQGSLAPVHWLVAAAIGIVVPRAVDAFLGAGTRLRAPITAVRLVVRVLWDIVVANLAVARIVLDPRDRARPAWVRVELALEHPSAVALLASIVTMTPGTVSCVIDETRRVLFVHALDCADPAQMAADIKARYERPLQEMIG